MGKVSKLWACSLFCFHSHSDLLFIFYLSVLKTYLGSSEARHSFHVFSISLIKFPLGTTRRWQPGNIWLIFNKKKRLSSVDLGNHCSIWDSKENSYCIYELRNIVGFMWSATLYHAWVNLSCSMHLMPFTCSSEWKRIYYIYLSVNQRTLYCLLKNLTKQF